MKYLNKTLLGGVSIALLTACGGGADNKVADDSHPNEPIKLSASNWQDTQAKLLDTATLEAKLMSIGHGRRGHMRWDYYLRLILSGTDQKPQHTQFHIDIDNNPATGYQFTDEAWSNLSGVDYIIEDNQLYKSTANDSSWSWKWVQQVSGSTTSTGSKRRIKLNKQKTFEPLCNDLNIGYMEFDENWGVTDFFPKSNKMLKQTISWCKTYNVPPVLTLNGVNNMTVALNDPQYADPGATASDEEDGDISANIIVTSTVNIATVGNYSIEYKVTDSNGNTVTKTRQVNVVTPTQGGITVDGLSDDWTSTNALVSERYVQVSGHFRTSRSYTLKATDTQENLYLYANAWVQHPGIAPPSASGPTITENWQVYLDTDNNASTGYSGYNYLIENGDLYSFSGSSSNEWAWQYVATVDSARGFTPQRPTRGNVELALQKSLITNWSDKIKIRVVAVNDNWSPKFAIPTSRSGKSNVEYTLENN